MGILGMMTAGGAGFDVAPWLAKMPCAVCTVELEVERTRAAGAPDALAALPATPLPTVTIVAGTPVCAEHGRELLGVIFDG